MIKFDILTRYSSKCRVDKAKTLSTGWKEANISFFVKRIEPPSRRSNRVSHHVDNNITKEIQSHECFDLENTHTNDDDTTISIISPSKLSANGESTEANDFYESIRDGNSHSMKLNYSLRVMLPSNMKQPATITTTVTLPTTPESKTIAQETLVDTPTRFNYPPPSVTRHNSATMSRLAELQHKSSILNGNKMEQQERSDLCYSNRISALDMTIIENDRQVSLSMEPSSPFKSSRSKSMDSMMLEKTIAEEKCRHIDNNVQPNQLSQSPSLEEDPILDLMKSPLPTTSAMVLSPYWPQLKRTFSSPNNLPNLSTHEIKFEYNISVPRKRDLTSSFSFYKGVCMGEVIDIANHSPNDVLGTGNCDDEQNIKVVV